MKRIWIIMIISVFSCQSSANKTLNYGAFEITVPKDWTKLKLKGIDSYVGGLVTSTKDTLIFDLGMYSNDIGDDFPMVYDAERLAELTPKERELLPTTRHLIVDSLPFHADLKKYVKYEVKYDTIDCFKAKIITPRNKGFGATGIYIDALEKDIFGNTRFSFYGNHLSDSIQQQFLKALKSLNFKEYCN